VKKDIIGSIYKAPIAVLAMVALLAIVALLAASCSKPSQNGIGPATGTAAAPQAPGQAGGTQGQAGQGRQGGAPGGAQGTGSFGGQGGARRATVIPVQATVVPFGTLSADRDTAGIVTPLIQSQIAAPVSGIVQKVLKQAGDWVGAGTVVVQLDDSLLKIAYANAQAAVDTANINLATAQQNASDSIPRLELQVQSADSSVNSAQRTYDSQKALFDLGGISASALDLAGSQLSTAKANLETAKLALDQARKGVAATPAQNVDALKVALVTAQNNLAQAKYNLENASIKAPFDGQIASMSANPGMFLGQNSAAFVLVSRERQVSFSIAPSDAHAIIQGMGLVYDIGGKSLPIRVRQTPSNPISGVVPMTASFGGQVELPYGSIGNVSYLVELAKGTLVPLNAIGTLENRNFVYLVVNGRVTTQNILVIAESGIIAAVTGLSPGSLVVISPPPGLIVGAQVQVIETPMPQSSAVQVAAAPAAGQAPPLSSGAGRNPAAGSGSNGQYGGQRQGQTGGQGGATGVQGGATGGQYGGQRTGSGQYSGQYSGQRRATGAAGGTAQTAPGTTTQPSTGTIPVAGSGTP
jgi:multidrug efflux pump subunit AcrA (membrane-fusion protein)